MGDDPLPQDYLSRESNSMYKVQCSTLKQYLRDKVGVLTLKEFGLDKQQQWERNAQSFEDGEGVGEEIQN